MSGFRTEFELGVFLFKDNSKKCLRPRAPHGVNEVRVAETESIELLEILLEISGSEKKEQESLDSIRSPLKGQ